ncbi:MAG: 16S rRNA (adenine(1518)-N(6)/adenine(1519)-N(6))-dimethyltransferase RsmA [Candidatus ainarchaeum sp.]|nr:16S rRNA (adenine(1518)-N(6)/adenine(1519)-N(6))-dimethyltransferase RsmA [Candidatus ainarchaeum sp.]MDD3975996.1 16S rRNA (adenine(1518)-N(6)/adenine(1519)-N(6))-dimethyltransferase RsmA [Candidatus ainarchaeum sp.]
MQKKIYDLMLKYGFKPDYKFDQNFIITTKPIEKAIKALEILKEETILEIGPGTGNLTKEILKLAKKVIVIEKDKKLVEILKNEFENKNIEIINKDFLDVDLNKIKFDKIIGFIPYSISQEILEKINSTKKTVLMVQKEFADKLIAIEGFENYVATTVLAQSYGNIKFIANIKKNNFYPRPKVDSTLIEINPYNIKKDEKYIEFIKTIFRFSNKDLLNGLKLAKKINPKMFNKINIEKIDLKTKKLKIKQINVNQFKEIYKKIF